MPTSGLSETLVQTHLTPWAALAQPQAQTGPVMLAAAIRDTAQEEASHKVTCKDVIGTFHGFVVLIPTFRGPEGPDYVD